MARARRSAKRRSRPSRKFDWVYRGKEWDVASGDVLSANGGYQDDEVTISTGVVNATSLVLYDSQNYTSQNLMISPANSTQTFVSRAARAEGRRPLVKAVSGTLLHRPSAWAVGNVTAFGWRIIIAEQDTDDGFALLDADYTMWNPAVTDPGSDVSIWRNWGRCLAEGFVYRDFATNSARIMIHPRWSGKPRALQPEEGLFLYLEVLAASSVTNSIVIPKMRALVADES